jgi:hypothetical protein
MVLGAGIKLEGIESFVNSFAKRLEGSALPEKTGVIG